MHHLPIMWNNDWWKRSTVHYTERGRLWFCTSDTKGCTQFLNQADVKFTPLLLSNFVGAPKTAMKCL